MDYAKQLATDYTRNYMRDATKVVIGIGSIWGLFAFGAMLLSSFTLGANDSAPEVLALVLYGLTILPACILSIWFRRPAALWLIALSLITIFGLIYQMVKEAGRDDTHGSLAHGIITAVLVAAAPAILGIFLVKTSNPKPATEG